MAHAVGRPTKYNKKYCQAIIDYFKVDPWEDVELTHRNKKGEEWTTSERRANKMPTFLGFAESIDVNGDTIVEWANAKKIVGKDTDGNTLYEPKYPEFSAAYKKAKEFQKWFLIENGLNSLYNPVFAIFTAKNITDMKDKQEIDHTTLGKELQVGIVSYADIKVQTNHSS